MPKQLSYPRQIQVCGATFTRPQHVGRHMRSHTGDKPYHCKECPEKFARSDLLSRHVNKTHGSADGGDGKINGRLGAGGRKKARKPNFVPSALALQQARNQINPHAFTEHGQTQRHGTLNGQHLQNLQSPFTTQAFQPSQNVAYMQARPTEYPASRLALSNPQAMGGMVVRPQGNPSYGMTYVPGTGKVAVPGYEVDDEDDDDDQWVNVPHDYNGSSVGSTFENSSSSGNPQSSMQGHYASFSPAAGPVHAAHMMNNVLEPSPQIFWSESPQHSSPIYPGMPVYSQAGQHNMKNNYVSANTYGSSSPFSLADPARLGQTSESPVAIGRNIMMRNGSSPLAPSPGGMTHPGPLPTAYSSVMPAPLIPTGTPLVDRIEKVKKRACEACNQSKVKCDFEVPCGKCASRKLTCVYPTARKPNRKTTFSSSPLSPETSDTGKPTLISHNSAAREIQPVFLSAQETLPADGLMSSPTTLAMLGGIAANANTSIQPQTDGTQSFSPVFPEGPSQPFSIDMGSARSQAYPAYHANMLNTGVRMSDTAYPATFTQMRPLNDEDSQSSVSGHTFGDTPGVDSRRSSLAEPYAAGDQHIDNALPFNALTLNGATLLVPGDSHGNDVQQRISDSVAVQTKAENDMHVNDGSVPYIVPHQPFFWGSHPVGMHDPKSASALLSHPAAPPNQREMAFVSRPSLVRGRSNSVPALHTPRAAADPTHYFMPVMKSPLPSEHSVLPQDWNAQIQHMTSQLNRNGSGTSSLQQVEDTIDITTQPSPRTHVPASDDILTITPHVASSMHDPHKSSRPGPAVIQNNMSLTMAKQLLSGRGSLQTLAPERTASFLDSTPSAELDGMKWNINLTSNVGAARIESPLKMSDHLVRPGNKRLASQTLGPDMQKRQSISSPDDALSRQQSSLNPQMNRVTTMLASQSVSAMDQFPGRRASIPSWLPDPASGNQGLMDNAVNHNMTFTPANQPMYSGRSAMDLNSNAPPSFFPDLTPTLFDPMQQGFNFNPADLSTPTYERGALVLNQIL
ncbi:hypothetical protein QFC22_000828 [Naganishia vaughanmartiniae]|uniref:Uncharacterized protein n=1 Tax=Naganishia vaughanmartiniae TaxID=1424756 RepID=A0ACC2XKX4_9TREE|nr:hypothetical protein QFC22_000828 [Naganishia vaughanmartiniae]